MQTRVLLAAGAIALLAASCAQPEPQVLSEAPRSASSADLTSPSQTTEEEAQPGRFIARCATEADGGTPGMTFFTDGSQNVTDHCLSRYYIGVQPAPGALYVPNEDAGSFAPTRESATSEVSGTSQWTPAQPRTDQDPLDTTDEERDPLDEESSTPGTDEPDTTETEDPSTSPGETTPTSPPTSPTDPTSPGATEPGTDEPGSQTPGETDTETSPTSPPGSAEQGPPTEVPTTAGGAPENREAEPPAPASIDPAGSLGSISSQVPPAPQPMAALRSPRLSASPAQESGPNR